MRTSHSGSLRSTAGLLATLLLLGLTGCTRTINAQSAPGTPAPATAPSRSTAVNGQPRQGLTTKQKVILLAGAAALYYLYKKHQQASGSGAEGQYYRSKNGQVYYRDQKGGVHWVSAPSQPIQVPADEYQWYTAQRTDVGNGQVIRQAPAGW